MQFKILVENQFNKRIKIIQCDGGGEFKSFQKVASDTRIQFKM